MPLHLFAYVRKVKKLGDSKHQKHLLSSWKKKSKIFESVSPFFFSCNQNLLLLFKFKIIFNDWSRILKLLLAFSHWKYLPHTFGNVKNSQRWGEETRGRRCAGGHDKKLSFSCGILGEIKRAVGAMPYAAMGSLAMSNDGGNNTDRTVGCVVRCIHAWLPHFGCSHHSVIICKCLHPYPTAAAPPRKQKTVPLASQ